MTLNIRKAAWADAQIFGHTIAVGHLILQSTSPFGWKPSRTRRTPIPTWPPQLPPTIAPNDYLGRNLLRLTICPISSQSLQEVREN